MGIRPLYSRSSADPLHLHPLSYYQACHDYRQTYKNAHVWNVPQGSEPRGGVEALLVDESRDGSAHVLLGVAAVLRLNTALPVGGAALVAQAALQPVLAVVVENTTLGDRAARAPGVGALVRQPAEAAAAVGVVNALLVGPRAADTWRRTKVKMF